tara:strand:+ start:275 stop:1402 length:1128 start_codon:yes stop_codon:yes gene_type:complete
MQDGELYRRLMGLREPWKVVEVRVDFAGLKVDVWVEWVVEQQGVYPECGKTCRIYDHRKERQWRHLDTMQFQTIMHCRIPRVNCAEHGTKSMEMGWAEKNSRFTALFERLSIDVLLGCQNQTKVKELLKLSWDEVHLIQEKAVQRGFGRRVGGELRHLGVDEKSFLRGHRYVTVLSDLDNPRVLDVACDRREEFLEELVNKLWQQQRDQITAVVLDMWGPFIHAVEQRLPRVDIVHDTFHIAKYLGEAVDKVRKKENRKFVKQDDDTLKGTKYLRLTNPNRWTELQEALFEELKDKGLKVGRAWSIKEMFSEFWEYRYEKAARNCFKKWYWWATHARLKPMAEVAKKLKRHLDNILTYLKHRITNAVFEGLNSKI